MKKEVTKDDYSRLIHEEIAKFVKENQKEIVKRAHARLREEMREKSGKANG
jgi:hypothetical protein